MALVSMQDTGVEARPVSFESLFDGVSARYCNIDGKYHMPVRDLIIGLSYEKPIKTKEDWIAAGKYASNTWLYLIKTSRTGDLTEYLKTFHFKGNLYIPHESTRTFP